MPFSVRKLTSRIGALIDFPRCHIRVTVAGDFPASVEGRRSCQLVGDASHYSRVLEAVA
jgi:taurine dioxygenase